MGPAAQLRLAAGLELGRRQHLDGLREDGPLSTPGRVGAFLIAQLRDRRYEVFCCLHLDAQHRFVARSRSCSGGRSMGRTFTFEKWRGR
jgi:DNA repair protein RadC